PVISVDTKKRELVGNFKKAGGAWRKTPRDVLEYDYPSDAVGVAIPFGIYDVARNEGFVVVGTQTEIDREIMRIRYPGTIGPPESRPIAGLRTPRKTR
ncbi:MAG: hypothetical protein J2P21_32795, partial [Chloracidobacterium sp.]|nr:hypothetical protein [Chloracidobacterium sp.]